MFVEVPHLGINVEFKKTAFKKLLPGVKEARSELLLFKEK
jgi:hypothetical protein